jgi:hypothetical protein
VSVPEGTCGVVEVMTMEVMVTYGPGEWVYDGPSLQMEQPLLFWFARTLKTGGRKELATGSGLPLTLERLA